jgi:hypothetical protein
MEEKVFELYTCMYGAILKGTAFSIAVWSKDMKSDGDYKVKVTESSVLVYDENGIPSMVMTKGVELVEEENCS